MPHKNKHLLSKTIPHPGPGISAFLHYIWCGISSNIFSRDRSKAWSIPPYRVWSRWCLVRPAECHGSILGNSPMGGWQVPPIIDYSNWPALLCPYTLALRGTDRQRHARKSEDALQVSVLTFPSCLRHHNLCAVLHIGLWASKRFSCLHPSFLCRHAGIPDACDAVPGFYRGCEFRLPGLHHNCLYKPTESPPWLHL